MAQLPSGLVVYPTGVVETLTTINNPGGTSKATDPAEVLSDDLACGPGWGGFVSLGGVGGQIAVEFATKLPVGTRIRGEEVDPSICSTASANPETWVASVCQDVATCVPLGDCTLGGPCEFLITEAHMAD